MTDMEAKLMGLVAAHLGNEAQEVEQQALAVSQGFTKGKGGAYLDLANLDDALAEGWKVVSVTPVQVAVSSAATVSCGYGSNVLIILERKKQ